MGSTDQRARNGMGNTKQKRFWYEDAVFYALDLKTFKDADGDGWGDFRGLTKQLDYLSWLGVDAVWLLPFYPSPHRDNGYDVADHYGVDPRYGSPGDLVTLLREAEARDIRVVADLVINHTSDEHPWFESARQGPRSPFYDYYIWSKAPENEPPVEVVLPGMVDSPWQYDPGAGAFYLHHFFDFQPDLSATHPAVRREARNIVDYWLRFGMAGFRVDAAPFLRNHHDPPEQLHDLLNDLHRWAVERTPDALLLAEADRPTEELAAYFGDGDEMRMIFNFFLNQSLFLALATEDAAPLFSVCRELPEPPAGCTWLNFLRHHDELSLSQLTQRERNRVYRAFGPEERMQVFGRGLRRRLTPMLGDRRRVEMAFSFLFSLPGAPMIYYGHEIGMGEDLDLPERYAVRTPMQWSDEEPHGGFSSAPSGTVIRPAVRDEPYGFRRVNVAEQREDPDSLLHRVRRMVQCRKAYPQISQGDLAV